LPQNEDGEFELILGNRQLLSVFFIVVILLGVFFTMGYIVGRNSGAATAEVAANPNPDTKPPSVETPAKTPESAPAPATPTETSPQPAQTDRQPEPIKPDREKPALPKAEPVRSATTIHPAAGQTYLQLAATNQHEADIMVDVLRKKSFHAMAAEIDEKPGTFRVLVGPITDTTANKMRADLQGAGFPGNAAIRRTF
jgi:cell division septation protein DedD